MDFLFLKYHIFAAYLSNVWIWHSFMGKKQHIWLKILLLVRKHLMKIWLWNVRKCFLFLIAENISFQFWYVEENLTLNFSYPFSSNHTTQQGMPQCKFVSDKLSIDVRLQGAVCRRILQGKEWMNVRSEIEFWKSENILW